MLEVIYYYDICAIIILMICASYFIRTNTKRTSRYNMYLAIVILGFLSGVTDLARILLADFGFLRTELWLVAHIMYLFLVFIAVPVYYLMVVGVTDTWHLWFKKPVQHGLSVVILIVGIAVIISGFFTDSIVAIDENGIHDKWGYVLLNLGIIVFLLLAFYYIRSVSSYFKRAYSLMLYVPIVTVVIALLIQLVYPEHHLIAMVISINCLMLLLVSGRAEETLDVATGMYTFNMFARDAQLKSKTGKKMCFIFCNIVNYDRALRIAGYDEVMEMMSLLSMDMAKVLKHQGVKSVCYCNGEGKLIVEVSYKNVDKLDAIAVELLKSINENIRLEISDFELKIKNCVVRFPEDVDNVEGLFMLMSDMDSFPDNGRVLSAADITGTKEFQMRKDMNNIIDRALGEHYFTVYYQPIYSVKQKRFASAEALIRLRDPKYGFVSPGFFIPLAEKSGSIHKIGSFVIDEVCKFVASEEFEQLHIDYIEINLSVKQCIRADLADEIIAKAKKYRIDPKKINLEITETASTYSMEKMYGNVMKLSDHGFTFSLDDFGTGYSNLMRITSLPFSIIKLDRSFVLLEEKGSSGTVIKNLISTLKEMGHDVLVEGIETEEMVNTFTEYGVDEIQGFYYSKPLPKLDYIAFLKKKMSASQSNK